jgi:hypothetical protein
MSNDVTQLLNAPEQGDPHAAEELLPLVYQELRELAAQWMAQEQPGQTLQPTAMVHEAYWSQGPATRNATFSARSQERFCGWPCLKYFALEGRQADVQRVTGPSDKSARACPGPSSMRWTI